MGGCSPFSGPQPPASPPPLARRFETNPLITLTSSPSLGDNINGPAVIRVPPWIKNPLGRYYLYFSHHRGEFIRMAYADDLKGPWSIYEPGVLNVQDTAFFRPRPERSVPGEGMYTHVASPDVVVDESTHEIQLWYHGWWTDGQPWPEDPETARPWATQHHYEQYTQVAVSGDGLHFVPRDGLTEASYLRIFHHQGRDYALGRGGDLLRAEEQGKPLVKGPNPFDGSPHAGRIRHGAVLKYPELLRIFYSVVGDTPERIWMADLPLVGDWTRWRTLAPVEILRPQTPWECTHLPVTPSTIGPPPGAVQQLRDPAVLEDQGKTYLFYTFCGERGIAGADLTLPPPPGIPPSPPPPTPAPPG